MGLLKNSFSTAAIVSGLSLICGLSLSTAYADQSTNQTNRLAISDITFTDPNFRACVEENAAQQNVTQASELLELVCSNRNISQLNGAEQLTNLSKLDLSVNLVSDLSPLSELTQLSILYLGDNRVSDAAPIANLTALTELSLRTNQLSDITALANMTNMVKLYLRQNSISNIAALTQLNSMTHLWLSDNQISDISALSSTTAITDLYLTQNQISDISALNNLNALSIVNLAQNDNLSCHQLYDLETRIGEGLTPPDLCDSPAVSSVNFSDTNLQACFNSYVQNQGWSVLDEITELRCANNNIVNLNGIEDLYRLDILDLSINRISDLSPLSHLNTLSVLYLGDNQITDASPISQLPLTDLSLRTNQISNLTPLANMSLMKKLYLRDNNISDISALNSMPALTHLWLSNNQISDISPIGAMTAMIDLYLYNNQISDITALNNLAALSTVNIAENNDIACSQLSVLESRLGTSNVTRPDSCSSPYIAELTFPDTQLRSCVINFAAQNGWTLVSQMNELRCVSSNITNLVGVEKLTALKVLDLSINQISDLTPLSDLTTLNVLYLGDNQISDIAPISQLVALTDLSLRTNQISDLTPLSNMTAMKKLYLRDNNISDISALADMTQLTHLWLSNNQISDISVIANMTQMTDLWLTNNQIEDISPLKQLTNLTALNLVSNDNISCSSLDELAELVGEDAVTRPESCYSPALSGLQFADARLRSCVINYGSSNGWSTVADMTELRCAQNNISNLSGIENLTKLNLLDLSINQISNLSSLSTLTSLTVLYLGDNQISNTAPLSQLTSLTDLSLRTNQVSDISPLSNLRAMKKLYLRDNNITNISALAAMSQLTHLWIFNNQISNLNPLATLTAMTDLYLGNNQIVDITALHQLTQLNIVDLTDNNSIKCADLDALETTLGNNVVNRPAECAPIDALPAIEYYATKDQTLRSYIMNDFSANGTLRITKEAQLGQFTLSEGGFSYQANNLGNDVIEITRFDDANKPIETMDINIEVGMPMLVNGYPSKTTNDQQLSYGYSAYPGETISWHLNGITNGQFQLPITTSSGKLIGKVTAQLSPQSINNEEPWLNGFGYSRTFNYTVPANMKSGIYFLGGHDDLFFVVKQPVVADIVVVIPTNTMNAYSCAGHRSMYNCWDGGDKEKVPKVSFLRPIRDRRADYTDALGLIIPNITWLDEELVTSNTISYITDLELDDLSYYQNAKLMMIPGHNEYWTHIAQKNYDQYTQQMGKNSWVGGGNVMWWASRYEDNNNTLVTYKYVDPEAPSPDLATVLFLSLGVDIIKSIGGDFERGGYGTNKMENPDQPSPMRITQPNSPLFRNTNMNMCDHIDMSPDIELDGAPIVGFDADGLPVADTAQYDTYRHEIIGYNWGFRGGHTIGTMHVHQQTAQSGYVVQFGSMGSTGYSFLSNDGAKYRTIMSNVVDILTSNQSPFSADVDKERPVVYPFVIPFNGDRPESLYEQCAISEPARSRETDLCDEGQ